MNGKVRRLGVVGLGCAMLAGVLVVVGATGLGAAQQTVKGLEISVSGVSRAENVSLTDCPPGANIVRGVIRPGDTGEFVTVTVDVKVLPSFEPTFFRAPAVQDESGKSYRTAQAFADVNSQSEYSCDFSFRVPTGTKVVSFAIEDASFDISDLEE